LASKSFDKCVTLSTFLNARFISIDLFSLFVTNLQNISNDIGDKLLHIFPMFSGDRLVGYWDMNEEASDCAASSSSTSKNNDTTAIIHKLNFNSNPRCYNCIIQQNPSGLIELVSVRNIAQSEQVVCWFADSYFKNIKSKFISDCQYPKNSTLY